jgi:ubiquinone/menaquinone biosynthesis C-methylase UbiE
MQASTTWRASAREFFNGRAEDIDGNVNPATLCYASGREQRLWTNPELYDDMMADIQLRLQLTQEQRLLEVGCAAGFLARGLARMVQAYTGVDIAPRAVDVSRSLGIPNADFQVADGTRLPWPDGTFDRVICCDVFANFPSFDSVAKVLTEMARVCRPGGKIMAGSLPDEAVKEAFQQKVTEVSQELDKKYGPVTGQPIARRNESPSFFERMRRWLPLKSRRVKPEIICYYFRKEDFIQFAKPLGLTCQIHDIHPLNPYRGFRFNAIYSKARQG